MKIFLFISTRHRKFGIFNNFPLLSLKLCKVHYFGKRWFFMKYLKDSSLYDRFSIHMYKAWSVRFLWLFCAICDSLMPCTVHFLEKDEFSMKYFKLVHAPTWKIPQYMNCFLLICTRHRVRYLQLVFAICDSLMLCKVHCFGKRWFFHEIFQVGTCSNLKDSLIYENFSIHLYKT